MSTIPIPTEPADGTDAPVPARPVLEIAGLVVAYGADPVLQGIDLTVTAGQSLALIGPNGAGKSTLLRSVLGLTPVRHGTIRVLGTSAEAARPRVAYVPQADTLDPEFPVSVHQVVLMGRYRRVGFLRRPGATDRAAARDALERVGLAHRSRDRFGTLSGGQRQRVLLARAIAQRAELLLLDEPFNGVDGASQQLLLRVLAELRATGTTVIMSTHDLALAHLACSEACILNRHQVACGPVAATITAQHLTSAYGTAAVALAEGAVLVTTR